MARIRRVVVIRLVATDTSRRQRRVVVVHVAHRARDRRVEAGQRERRVVVIEGRIRPQHGVVAQFAGGREASMRNRRRGAVKGGLMARNARGDRDVVIAVKVAAGARRRQVRPNQRPSRRRVVELSVGPNHRVVAVLAGRRESRVRHWGRGVVEVGLMAGNARRNRDVVVVIDVTAGARRRQVRPRQREARRRVIEGGIRP